jgi:hypothetical protein
VHVSSGVRYCMKYSSAMRPRAVGVACSHPCRCVNSVRLSRKSLPPLSSAVYRGTMKRDGMPTFPRALRGHVPALSREIGVPVSLGQVITQKTVGRPHKQGGGGPGGYPGGSVNIIKNIPNPTRDAGMGWALTVWPTSLSRMRWV